MAHWHQGTWQQGTQSSYFHPLPTLPYLPLDKLVPVVAGEGPAKRSPSEMLGREGREVHPGQGSWKCQCFLLFFSLSSPFLSCFLSVPVCLFAPYPFKALSQYAIQADQNSWASCLSPLKGQGYRCWVQIYLVQYQGPCTVRTLLCLVRQGSCSQSQQ